MDFKLNLKFNCLKGAWTNLKLVSISVNVLLFSIFIENVKSGVFLFVTKKVKKVFRFKHRTGICCKGLKWLISKTFNLELFFKAVF